MTKTKTPRIARISQIFKTYTRVSRSIRAETVGSPSSDRNYRHASLKKFCEIRGIRGVFAFAEPGTGCYFAYL
jgi:hypothetical protein